MTMQAIKVTEANVEKILSTGTSIVKFDMAAFVNENEANPLYYIPDMDDSEAEPSLRWATFPESVFLRTFNADMTNIETDFVNISWK